jgi:hypothetical protein
MLHGEDEVTEADSKGLEVCSYPKVLKAGAQVSFGWIRGALKMLNAGG